MLPDCLSTVFGIPLGHLIQPSRLRSTHRWQSAVVDDATKGYATVHRTMRSSLTISVNRISNAIRIDIGVLLLLIGMSLSAEAQAAGSTHGAATETTT